MAGIDCKIKLHSKQQMGADQEITEETYSGSYIDRGDKKYISYKRQSEEGEIDCLISFNHRSMTMNQKGALNSKLLLEPGKKTDNAYSTPVGTLSLQIFTRHYQVVESKNEVKLIIDYDIVTGTEPISTSMDILIEF